MAEGGGETEGASADFARGERWVVGAAVQVGEEFAGLSDQALVFNGGSRYGAVAADGDFGLSEYAAIALGGLAVGFEAIDDDVEGGVGAFLPVFLAARGGRGERFFERVEGDDDGLVLAGVLGGGAVGAGGGKRFGLHSTQCARRLDVMSSRLG